jgi:hypothetical protein
LQRDEIPVAAHESFDLQSTLCQGLERNGSRAS